jgi:hypothetical protein
MGFLTKVSFHPSWRGGEGTLFFFSKKARKRFSVGENFSTHSVDGSILAYGRQRINPPCIQAKQTQAPLSLYVRLFLLTDG